MIRTTLVVLAVACAAVMAAAQGGSKPVPVTVDNFIRAETDMYFATTAKEAGGAGRFMHRREVADVQHQTVVRLNRDTLYSSGVFDLDAGPVTVTLPDAGPRFRSLMVIDQDHYVAQVSYAAGAYTFAGDRIGTRYLVAAVRTLVNPTDASDVRAAHALQDAIRVQQKSPGRFEAPNWEPQSQKKVRDALLVLGSTINAFKGAFGGRKDVDPIKHLIGTAAGWGGNPDKDATYLGIDPPRNDGVTVHTLTVGQVPVDGFWSISVYNAQGFFEPNALNAYSVNNITAGKAADGSVRVQFGGCDGKIPNCLPIMKGWNYTVRMYRPRVEILNGTWKFPEAQPR